MWLEDISIIGNLEKNHISYSNIPYLLEMMNTIDFFQKVLNYSFNFILVQLPAMLLGRQN